MLVRVLALCTLLAVFAFATVDAGAARMGGGRSFGGKPSMSQPFRQSAPPTSTMRQSQTGQQQGAVAAAAGSRGMFGGMGGMLGGLLAGSLIGSMLFGGGFSGGGFMDILLIAALLYFGYKFFARRRAASQGAGAGGGTSFSGNPYGPAATPKNAPSGWDALSSRESVRNDRGTADMFGGAGATSGTPFGAAAQETAKGPDLPAGFDTEEFLRGAKAAYTRLNEAWDSRELDDIAQFATPGFMGELRKQAEEDPTPATTEILMVDAAMVGVRTEGDEEIASVYFTVLLREDPKASAPTEVREVWHFTRPATGNGAWKLDGIQQAEA